MKKISMLLMLLLASVFILAACSGGSTESSGESNGESSGASSSGESSNSEETIKLRVGSGVTQEHFSYQSFFNAWMERVEEETNVEFELHLGGSLISMGQGFEALNDGLVDVVMPLYPLYDTQRFPLSEVSMLPVVDTTVNAASKAYADIVFGNVDIVDGKNYQELEFGDRDLKLWPAPTTEAYSMSFANGQPTSMDDISGLSMRTPGRVLEIFSREIGVNPVSLPATEAYDALSRGAIDGIYFSISDWSSYGLDELFDYTIRGANLGYFSHIFGMTQQTWDSLPADVQDVMERVTHELIMSDQTYQTFRDLEEKDLTANAEVGGVVEHISDQPQDIQDDVSSAMVNTWLEWIRINEENGVPGREIAKIWRDLIIEYGGDVPQEIHNLE
ncbi:hypothetical protein [Halalkalibacter alkaliphilus]|uniref:TRAP-type C4-dicarboxylate transport system, substrate-binding protein n=1 Tax=Halalkalibacter alkaliphilus TaxID=2917993 RepID=A0A9X2I8A5_9BACI|nr:hypothetical protein [Halalkalibacter alkaliphilus]MCL7749618.1 hypothetical protein [Halalkalibacter alkaliphilus]